MTAKHPGRLADLLLMREQIWASIDAADADRRAPLFARLESVLAQIETLEARTAKAGDPVDEIAARRDARRAAATAAPGNAKRGGK